MPHLQFEFNRPLSDEDRERLADWATIQYADDMETGTGHIAVSVEEISSNGLSLGRVTNGDPVVILNADIRKGRSYGQRERFANAVIDRLEEWFGVPRTHCYVIYTEHAGDEFLLDEGPLDSWSGDEADHGT